MTLTQGAALVVNVEHSWLNNDDSLWAVKGEQTCNGVSLSAEKESGHYTGRYVEDFS